MHLDCSDNRFLGITLDWDYVARTLTTSMPELVLKALACYGYDLSGPKANSPGGWQRLQYGAKPQLVTTDTSSPVSHDDALFLMSIISTFFWYYCFLEIHVSRDTRPIGQRGQISY